MSVESAPTEYFDNIYYNPSFYQQSNGISLAYGTANYVSRVGTATSVATTTSFSGSVLTNTISDTSSGAGTLSLSTNTLNLNSSSNNITGSSNFSDVLSTPSSVNIANTNGLQVNTITPNTGTTISVSADTTNILGITAININTYGSSGTCNLINSYNQITGSNTGFGTPANYILADTNGSYNQITAGYGTYMGYNQIDSQNVTGTYANIINARQGDNKIVSNTGANNIIGFKNSISSYITTPLVPADGYIYLQALTAISNYIGSVAKLTQNAILTTIANTTIALSGTSNTMTAVNSNVISTTGTSSGSNNQMVANGSATFPNANNLISATGYGGYNTIQAVNQAGNGYNIIQAWYLNQITTSSPTGTNELLSSGLNGSNYIHTSNTNGSNMILSSGTNGINTISAPQNTITSTTNNNIVNTGTGTNTITSLVSNTITSPLNTISANSAGGNNVFIGNAGAGFASNLIQATSGYNQLLGNAGTGVVSNTMYATSGDNKMNAINAGSNNILVANVANSLTASQNTITSTTNNNIVNTGTGTNTITSLVSNTLTAPTNTIIGNTTFQDLTGSQQVAIQNLGGLLVSNIINTQKYYQVNAVNLATIMYDTYTSLFTSTAGSGISATYLQHNNSFATLQTNQFPVAVRCVGVMANIQLSGTQTGNITINYTSSGSYINIVTSTAITSTTTNSWTSTFSSTIPANTSFTLSANWTGVVPTTFNRPIYFTWYFQQM